MANALQGTFERENNSHVDYVPLACKHENDKTLRRKNQNAIKTIKTFGTRLQDIYMKQEKTHSQCYIIFSLLTVIRFETEDFDEGKRKYLTSREFVFIRRFHF